jgi:hypothetical protein
MADARHRMDHGAVPARSGWRQAVSSCRYDKAADLPARVIRGGEETRLLPCAAALLSERALEVILAPGLMQPASHARLRSIADPLQALAGMWPACRRGWSAPSPSQKDTARPGVTRTARLEEAVSPANDYPTSGEAVIIGGR